MAVQVFAGLSRLAVSVYFFFCGLIFSTWAARIPATKDQFGMNDAQLGAMLFMLPLGAIVALPAAGWAVHRWGSRATTLTATVGYGCLLIGIGLSSKPWQLSIALFFFGFFGDLLNIAMNTQGLGVQKKMARPILSGLHGLWSVGALAGALLGGWSLRRDWTTLNHFMLVGMICIVLGIFFYFFMVADEGDGHSGTSLFSWPDKALWILGMICFCTAMAEGAMADWSSLYYRQVLRDPDAVSTTGYTAFTFAMAIGRLSGDRIIQVLRYRNTLIMNGFFIALGLGIALGFQVPAAVISGYALVGLGVSSVIPIVYMIAGKSKVMKPSAALATVSTIGFTGFLAGPPVIGFIAHETGLRLALVLVLLLGLLISWLAGRSVGG
jgi:MFS family permease